MFVVFVWLKLHNIIQKNATDVQSLDREKINKRWGAVILAMFVFVFSFQILSLHSFYSTIFNQTNRNLNPGVSCFTLKVHDSLWPLLTSFSYKHLNCFFFFFFVSDFKILLSLLISPQKSLHFLYFSHNFPLLLLLTYT